MAHDGLRIRHSFVTHRRRWEDIDRFYTRTYRAYRFPDWTGVAFAHRDGWKANAASLLEDTFRTRGVFDTDLVPDTYGLPAKKLRSFLNACDVRWSTEKLGTAPTEISTTRDSSPSMSRSCSFHSQLSP